MNLLDVDYRALVPDTNQHFYQHDRSVGRASERASEPASPNGERRKLQEPGLLSFLY